MKFLLKEEILTKYKMGSNQSSPESNLVSGVDSKEFLPVEGKKYYTLDNGGHPFKVMIDGDKVKVYRQYDLDEELYEYRLIHTYTPNNILIGKSIVNGMTKFSGAMDDPEFDGNSILLDMGNNQYIFIGDAIYSFESYAPIKKFYSPVGNSRVVYPYAIDKSGNVYILLFDYVTVFVKTKKLHTFLSNPENDPYDILWRENNKKFRELPMLNIKTIQKRIY